MSMREYPLSGYVVPVLAFKRLIADELHAELDRLLEEYDREAISAFLEAHVTRISSFSVYCPSDTDTVDEPMAEGVCYVIFDEDELYEKRKTAVHEMLLASGIEPEFANWSVWG